MGPSLFQVWGESYSSGGGETSSLRKFEGGNFPNYVEHSSYALLMSIKAQYELYISYI